ncbi:DNA polymerase [Xanthomonas phage L522]|nr:DNA polymerase [Xanthomonas phage L522]
MNLELNTGTPLPMSQRGWLAWDLETGTRTLHKRKASPFDAQNDIWAVGFGRSWQESKGYHKAVTGIPKDWFRAILNNCRVLVGYNIKFDLLYALRDKDNHTAWMRWVTDGGKVWDCQLAEYLLQGMAQEWQIASMDDVAPLYGGSCKDHAVKACWENGIDTGEIDPDMLMDYLLGTGEDNLGDIGNTANIFRGQLKLAKDRGQIASITLNNAALLYTVEAELNGMFVDVAKGEEIRQQLLAKLVQLSEQVNKGLPEDLPFDFNWASPKQRSALLFGGGIKYKSREQSRDEAGELLFAKQDVTMYITKDGDLVEPEKVVEGSELYYNIERYAGGKSKGLPKTKKVKVPDLSKPKMSVVEREYIFPGFVQPLPEWQGSVPGQYKTGEEVTQALASWEDAPEFVQQYAAQARITKDLGTYYYTVDPETGETKGMLSLVGKEGIVHHQLQMVNTVTGRLSSALPNLQNLPKGDKSEVKTLFTSRFDGGSIVQSDFTALEIYVQANLSGDKGLIADLRAGLDMHCKRVSQKDGVSYDYVVERAKDKAHPEHAEWSRKRSKAKSFSFARAYGAGAASIAASTGMTVDEVKDLIKIEDEMYPGIPEYNNRTMKELERNIVPSKMYIASSYEVGVSLNLGKSYFRTPDGKRYTMYQTQAPKWLWEREGVQLTFSSTTTKNYPVQGTGGEWMKAAMSLILQQWYARGNFGGRSLIVNTVHDAAYIDSAPEVAKESMALLHACMEEASRYIESQFRWKLHIDVPSETSIGPSMADEGEGPEGWKELVPEYRKQINKTFNNKEEK